MPAPIAPARLPFAATIPDDVSVASVRADLSDDGVSAPDSDVADLRDVVARAHEQGIDLKIVVLEKDPGRPEQLRDLATEIGTVDGGTVLVLSPSSPGTYSDTLSRVVLEGAQDRTYTGNAVQSANNFVDEIAEPGVSWGLVTALLVLVVAIVGGLSYVAKVRRGPASPTGTPVASDAAAGAPSAGGQSARLDD
ncbi:Rv1476 family membrane protein [Prescottella agglutinans]|uniref:Rv1476 family membrane protein n=1 Tax=Prescottella agglutinans TaxID=1644129 RepID=UPI003D968EF0